MHRVRQSVHYFEQFGYIPTVVCVNPSKIETHSDNWLLQTLPPNLQTIKVSAFSAKLTRKVGLGALALRSLFFLFF